MINSTAADFARGLLQGRQASKTMAELRELAENSGLSRQALLDEAGLASKERVDELKTRLNNLEKRIDVLLERL